MWNLNGKTVFGKCFVFLRNPWINGWCSDSELLFKRVLSKPHSPQQRSSFMHWFILRFKKMTWKHLACLSWQWIVDSVWLHARSAPGHSFNLHAIYFRWYLITKFQNTIMKCLQMCLHLNLNSIWLILYLKVFCWLSSNHWALIICQRMSIEICYVVGNLFYRSYKFSCFHINL